MLYMDGETMKVEVITQAVELYINGEVDEFDWNCIEEECRNEKKYYYNLIERLIKNYICRANYYIRLSMSALCGTMVLLKGGRAYETTKIIIRHGNRSNRLGGILNSTG